MVFRHFARNNIQVYSPSLVETDRQTDRQKRHNQILGLSTRLLKNCTHANNQADNMTI